MNHWQSSTVEDRTMACGWFDGRDGEGGGQQGPRSHFAKGILAKAAKSGMKGGTYLT